MLCLPDDEIQILGQDKLRETIATTSWYLWFERRKLTHGEAIQTPDQIVLAVRSLTTNFNIACAPKAKIRKNGWKKPANGYLKMNVDASFDSDLLQGIVGAVIRDHKGRFVAAANEKINVCNDVFTAEALAVRFGMNLARTVGCCKLQIESDNADVITSLQEGSSALAASAIFEDCYHMSLDFLYVGYAFCNRESNAVAHELAKLAKFSRAEVWLESPPGSLAQVLVNDTYIVEE